ncbi:hypothetical protein CHLNCDRAFT_33886 [Chlorella variabilis]|uniref:Uncharacterized protein n=1 Tax=Chlorella variabilis TaxID=554065 RepID=E1Z509_CHLVA|nr:hypothetical protein CHLNCDRAFT_33886 [Chlorella variabilis]EFN59440.1 hypothetical protein CHLNCDRAFT_33886 [Chlorella variabilis]|eukprot:XP_005851542.1 hypothetical protein CHLNCDRAFT_33886 [Chlorella variabilis]
MCSTATKPVSSQKCSIQPCITYSWQPLAWGACSAACGGGTRTRVVQCKDSTGKIVADAFCSGTKPLSSQKCNIQACVTYLWQTQDWGACTKSCGGGTQTRVVQCMDSTGNIVADAFCSGTKPLSSQKCNIQACVTYLWQTQDWGACTKSCGGGTQTRVVQCMDSTGNIVADAFCSGTKPLSSQKCNIQACVTYLWQTQDWGACTKSCGGGTQTRVVQCMDSTGNIVADAFCSGTKPLSSQMCNSQACLTYLWQTQDWGACTKSCGGGTQTRVVQCMDSTGNIVADAFCSGTKPLSSQKCNSQACATYSWETLDWGNCTESCGDGTQKRVVQCTELSGKIVADAFCTDTKPASIQTCNLGACRR